MWADFITYSEQLIYVPSYHAKFYDHQIHVPYQVVGAFWYLFSVESEVRCWHRQLKNTTFSRYSFLSCGLVDNPTVLSLLNRPTSCPHKSPDDTTDSTIFNFGIFTDALKSGVVESTAGFREKFFYCFWWGLRSVRLAHNPLIPLCSWFHMQD